MPFIRIRTYFSDGKFTGCEHLYLGNDETKAVIAFLKEYPSHLQCKLVYERYYSEDFPEHFKACENCGCVHYFY